MSTETQVQEDRYQILFPNGIAYRSAGEDAFTWHRAKIIARNVAMKRKVLVRLHKVEEVINWDTTYDQIQAYVDSLKGAALTKELEIQGLPKGSDPVASKRVRLVQHFVKKGSQ